MPDMGNADWGDNMNLPGGGVSGGSTIDGNEGRGLGGGVGSNIGQAARDTPSWSVGGASAKLIILKYPVVKVM